jgi:hypothetical protein
MHSSGRYEELQQLCNQHIWRLQACRETQSSKSFHKVEDHVAEF